MSRKQDAIERAERDVMRIGLELRGISEALAINAVACRNLRSNYMRTLGEHAAAVAKLRQLGLKKKPVARNEGQTK